MTDQLGFSVSCYKGDLPLLRGCLASIRFFAPDAPICLIIDGDIQTKALEKHYGVVPIRRSDVKDPGLRRWSFGFGITKMVAFWEAPFDLVFHIDADCVMWGDVRRNLPSDRWDVVFNEPHEVITDKIMLSQYFDPERIFHYIPDFAWENNPYFQAGVIAVRRNTLDLDEYLRMLEGQRRFPDVFINGDQGMLNILVFRAIRAGLIRGFSAHLQTVVPVISPFELAKRFVISQGSPVASDQPTVIHWAGPKPYMGGNHPFAGPMDYFRRIGMTQTGLPGCISPDMAMYYDELRCRSLPRLKQRLKAPLKALLRRQG